MDVSPVPRIDGALLLRPTPHVDERGFFCRTFDADVLRTAGIDPAAFVQHSLSRSVRGVVRGLHVRRGDGEAKLVRCSYGAIFDVVVDLRPDLADVPELGELRTPRRRAGDPLRACGMRARLPGPAPRSRTCRT